MYKSLIDDDNSPISRSMNLKQKHNPGCSVANVAMTSSYKCASANFKPSITKSG